MTSTDRVKAHQHRKKYGLAKLYVPKPLLKAVINLILSLVEDKQLKEFYKNEKRRLK